MVEIADRQQLEAWLEKQPADGQYNYENCTTCALAQYFTSHGYTRIIMGPREFNYDLEGLVRLPDGWNDLVNPVSFSRGWNTYGAALKRARAVQR